MVHQSQRPCKHMAMGSPSARGPGSGVVCLGPASPAWRVDRQRRKGENGVSEVHLVDEVLGLRVVVLGALHGCMVALPCIIWCGHVRFLADGHL